MYNQYQLFRAKEEGKVPFKLTDRNGKVRFSLAYNNKDCRRHFTGNWKIIEISWEKYLSSIEYDKNIDAQMKNPINE